MWLLATNFSEPLLGSRTSRARVLCTSCCHVTVIRDSGSAFFWKNVIFQFCKCSLTFWERWKTFICSFAHYVAYFFCCFICIMWPVYLHWEWVGFHVWKAAVLSQPLCQAVCVSFHFGVPAWYINVNVSSNSLSWHDSFRFISAWIILAKQQFEVAYLLATGIANLWAGSEIHFHLLVLKGCLRKFLQICNIYSSCHHPTFSSICLFLSPVSYLPLPSKAQKIPSKWKKKKSQTNKRAHMGEATH